MHLKNNWSMRCPYSLTMTQNVWWQDLYVLIIIFTKNFLVYNTSDHLGSREILFIVILIVIVVINWNLNQEKLLIKTLIKIIFYQTLKILIIMLTMTEGGVSENRS